MKITIYTYVLPMKSEEYLALMELLEGRGLEKKKDEDPFTEKREADASVVDTKRQFFTISGSMRRRPLWGYFPVGDREYGYYVLDRDTAVPISADFAERASLFCPPSHQF